MPNWFNKNYPQETETIRYRVMVPIDIKVESVGDDFENQSNVYGALRTMFEVGEERIKELHKGINVMLNFSDIQPYKGSS